MVAQQLVLAALVMRTDLSLSCCFGSAACEKGAWWKRMEELTRFFSKGYNGGGILCFFSYF